MLPFLQGRFFLISFIPFHFSLFLFVCDKYCHFVSLTWCFCFHNTFIISKSDEFRSTNICCLGLCRLFCMCLCFLKITILLHVLPSNFGQSFNLLYGDNVTSVPTAHSLFGVFLPQEHGFMAAAPAMMMNGTGQQ